MPRVGCSHWSGIDLEGFWVVCGGGPSPRMPSDLGAEKKKGTGDWPVPVERERPDGDQTVLDWTSMAPSTGLVRTADPISGRSPLCHQRTRAEAM